MQSTTSLETPLAPRSGIELLQLVGRFAADTAAWQSRVCLPQGGERWWTRLHGGADVDVWLLSWLPGQATDLHDHGGSTAAFTVVQGSLQEVRLDRTGHRVVKQRRTGATTVVPPRIIHDVHGTGHQPAVSIHAYSPPLTTMNFYALDAAGKPQLTDRTETREPEV